MADFGLSLHFDPTDMSDMNNRTRAIWRRMCTRGYFAPVCLDYNCHLYTLSWTVLLTRHSGTIYRAMGIFRLARSGDRRELVSISGMICALDLWLSYIRRQQLLISSQWTCNKCVGSWMYYVGVFI